MQTSEDDFLGGRLSLLQPLKGYRAGVDPVLLAAACIAQSGQSVLELGCGVGVASFALQARVGGLHLAGLEIQAEYAALARKNAQRCGVAFDVRLGDVSAPPAVFAAKHFDHVMANPPFFKAADSVQSVLTGRAAGRQETAPLGAWMKIAAKRLRPKGYLTLIQRIERLPDFLAACTGALGSIVICPIAPRMGRPPRLFLAQARKSGRATFRMTTPLIMHEGAQHESDGDDYTPQITEVLRGGAALRCFED